MLINMLQPLYIKIFYFHFFFSFSFPFFYWSSSFLSFLFHLITTTVTYSNCKCICLLWQCSLKKKRTKKKKLRLLSNPVGVFLANKLFSKLIYNINLTVVIYEASFIVKINPRKYSNWSPFTCSKKNSFHHTWYRALSQHFT